MDEKEEQENKQCCFLGFKELFFVCGNQWTRTEVSVLLL